MASTGRAEEILTEDEIDDIPEEEKADVAKDDVILGKPDILYEADDMGGYDERCRHDNFQESAAKFLEEELQKTLQYHQIELIATETKNERPGEIIMKALDLADQMRREDRLPESIGAKAALRLSLKKILYYGYNKNFELDGVPKFRPGRTFPSGKEQMKRHAKLEQARAAAIADSQMRKLIVSLTSDSIRMQMLPEMFHRAAAGGVEAEQLNDLAVNFLLWIMEKSPAFTEKQRVVVFLSLFKCVDRKHVVNEYIKAFETKDRKAAETEVDDAYEVTADTFRREGETMLQEFLHRAVLNGKDRKTPSRREELKGRRNILDIYFRDLRDVTHPANYREILLRSGEIMMAKRGNLSARNKFSESMLKYVVYHAKKWGGMQRVEENIGNANLMVLEKIIGFEPRYDVTPSTYLTYWIEKHIRRTSSEDATIRLPIHFMEARHKLASLTRKNPTLSEEEIDGLFQKRKRSEVLNRIRTKTYGVASQSLDAPGSGTNDNPSDSNLGEIIPDKSDLGRVLELTTEKEIIEKLGLILDALPPKDAIILRARIGLYSGGAGDVLTLEQVAAIYDISRERVRQILDKIFTKLSDGPGEYATYYRVKDPQAWEKFCESQGWDAIEVDVMNMAMGWDQGVYYNKCRVAQITEELQRRHGVTLGKKEILKMWRRICLAVLGDSEQEAKSAGLLEEIHERDGYALARHFIRQLSGNFENDVLMNRRVKEFFDSNPKPLDVDWARIMESVADVKSNHDKYYKVRRAAKRKLATAALPPAEEEIESAAESGPVSVEHHVAETRSDLELAIEEILSGDIRKVAIKIFMEKKPTSEVTAETGLPVNKVMMLSTLARIRLEELSPGILGGGV